MRVLHRNQWQDMDLKTGPSLPWNLFSLTLRNLRVLQETGYIKPNICTTSSMVLCFFSGKVFNGLNASWILQKGRGHHTTANFSSDALDWNFISLYAGEQAWFTQLLFWHRHHLTNWAIFFSSSDIWIGNHKIFYKVYFLFKMKDTEHFIV